MADARWSLQDAKNRFSAVVDAAVKGTPQTVTKHGKPAVVVVSFAEYQKLTKGTEPRRPSFVEHLLAFPKGDGRRFKITRLKLEPRDIEFE